MTKPFERVYISNERVTKPFERVYIFNERVTKPFERADGLNERVTKPFERADKRLVNGKPLVYVSPGKVTPPNIPSSQLTLIFNFFFLYSFFFQMQT